MPGPERVSGGSVGAESGSEPAAGPRWLVSILAALLLMGLLVGSAGADPLDDEARRIAKQLQCPVCLSVSVADSPSELAVQMRGVIRRKLQQGETEPEIVAYFVERYGDGVLLEPPRRGFSLAAWALPLAVLAGGAAIVAVALRRWVRPRPPGPAATPDTALDLPEGSAGPWVTSPGTYAERARAELDRFRGTH